jgi:predicted restriction endonuclease
MCDETRTLQAAHIFSRNNRSTRWDFFNILCLCAKHHFWAHQNPILFTEWVKEHLGDENYEALKIRAKSPRHFTIEEMKTMKVSELIEQLRQEVLTEKYMREAAERSRYNAHQEKEEMKNKLDMWAVLNR